MSHLLQNEQIALEIDLPSENYQLARFDWTGKIVSLRYKGKLLSGSELADPSENPNCGKGFYNEFGITTPVGYQEIEPGDWFPKLGVGLLKKEAGLYCFHHPYHIQPAQFDFALQANGIHFSCQSQCASGYAYRLEKEIKLLESGFCIQYQLENRGEKTILTDEYSHNFLNLDRTRIGKDHHLQFPFQIKPAHFIETVNPEDKVLVGAQDIRFKASPDVPFFFSNLSGGKWVPASWRLENFRNKIGISETGDFQTDSINLWGCGHVMSPELFVKLEVAPVQSIQWSRTFQIYDLA